MPNHRHPRLVPGLTLLLSAALLFQVQLIAGKALLPLFGGAAAVWTTCQLFFQSLLLAGYAYAHGLARLSPRRQLHVHAVLLASALLLLSVPVWLGGVPLLPPSDLPKNLAEAPWLSLLRLLATTTALPFLALSATGPLVQHWHARTAGEGTYRLYALSNAGSLLGLVGYPFLVEPWFGVNTQAWAWTGLFLVFAVLCLVCARRASLAPVAVRLDASPTGNRVGWERRGLWLALPLASSALLLAITNLLCQEVASVPFLWVLPLATYLLSFIAAFDKPAWYRRDWVVPALLVMTVVVLLAALLGVTLGIVPQVIVGTSYLGLFCLAAHGEAYRLRPPTEGLTGFYLCLSAGGAAGGLLVGLAAPALFRGYWELEIAVALGLALLGWVWWRDRESPLHRGGRRYCVLAITLASHVAGALGSALLVALRQPVPWGGLPWVPAGCGLALGLLVAWWRPGLAGGVLWSRVLLISVLLLSECLALLRVRQGSADVLAMERNFFGTLSVVRMQDAGQPVQRVLMHGRINHGAQYEQPPLRNVPVTYYGKGSGLELAVRHHPSRRVPGLVRDGLRIGVLGLGTGTLAAAAEPGDLVRFYEINPLVVRLASGPEALFSYVNESRGSVEVCLGDARLELARELALGKPGRFDFLVVDAFSSDSVPVHLLTIEAFRLYRSHLRNADSVLAVNVSNRFLDLRDLVASQGAEVGLRTTWVLVSADLPWRTPSVWMILGGGERFHQELRAQPQAAAWDPRGSTRWTDSFSNPAALLRWGEPFDLRDGAPAAGSNGP